MPIIIISVRISRNIVLTLCIGMVFYTDFHCAIEHNSCIGKSHKVIKNEVTM